jgi:hypothetical protein
MHAPPVPPPELVLEVTAPVDPVDVEAPVPLVLEPVVPLVSPAPTLPPHPATKIDAEARALNVFCTLAADAARMPALARPRSSRRARRRQGGAPHRREPA